MKAALKSLIVENTAKLRLLATAKSTTSHYAVSLERPSNHEIYAGDIIISGWFLDFDDCDVEIIAYFDGVKSFRIPRTLARPDVISHFLNKIEESSKQLPGFYKCIDWNSLGQNKHETALTLQFNRNEDSVLLGPFNLQRTSHPVLRHQRGSYKEVWEAAATTADTARATVTGESEAAFAVSGESSAETIATLTAIDPSCTVLEIGCGTGRIGKALAPRVAKWIGTDISSGMIDFAKEYLAGLNNVELVELFDVGLRQIPDSSIDRVYCCCVFMHLDEWDRYTYIKEAFRVLTPGGRLYVDNLNLEGDQGWEVFEKIWAMDAAQRSAAASKVSTGPELSTYFNRAGFQDVKTYADQHLVMCVGRKA